MFSRMARVLSVGVASMAMMVVALGADEPPQTVDVGGLTFQVPASWKSQRPTSSMRKAQLRVAPVEGEKDEAELVVFVFPGGAGTVEANVTRWQNQFKDDGGNAPAVQSKTLKGKNTEVTRVEVAGRYLDPFANTGPRPNFRLLGAIVTTDDAGYFLKMVGPDKTMKAISADFDKLIASISLK